VEIMKHKRHKRPDEQLILSIIENANNAIRNAYCTSQWVTINQGNDSY
jgi:hypothetical protein